MVEARFLKRINRNESWHITMIFVEAHIFGEYGRVVEEVLSRVVGLLDNWGRGCSPCRDLDCHSSRYPHLLNKSIKSDVRNQTVINLFALQAVWVNHMKGKRVLFEVNYSSPVSHLTVSTKALSILTIKTPSVRDIPLDCSEI